MCPQIPQFLENVSKKTDAFAQATGMHCKAGCGKCCEHPDVETTVAEMMPLAAHLWESGQAEKILAHIDSKPSKNICILYQPDPVIPGHGRCSSYEYRPGVCRLFGFSARKDKQGESKLVTCKVIKENFPQDFERAQEQVAQGLKAPMINEHALQIMNIDPLWGRELMPINQAIRIALERVGLSSSINSP